MARTAVASNAYTGQLKAIEPSQLSWRKPNVLFYLTLYSSSEFLLRKTLYAVQFKINVTRIYTYMQPQVLQLTLVHSCTFAGYIPS